ncbi:MAG: hypothetical protein L0216_12400 [Planctomycetales bacterium]|nr:hypothetical protein [Planctomycetales bacterium]
MGGARLFAGLGFAALIGAGCVSPGSGLSEEEAAYRRVARRYECAEAVARGNPMPQAAAAERYYRSGLGRRGGQGRGSLTPAERDGAGSIATILLLPFLLFGGGR